MSNYIAKNLRYLRRGLKLSQEGLAKMIDMNRGNIASYEKGTAEPNAAKLMRISRFFSVSLSDFIEKDLEEFDKAPRNYRTDFKSLVALQASKTREEIEQILIEFERLEKIYEGQLELHNFQLSKYDTQTANTRMLINDHERLLEVSGEMLRLFKEITGQISVVSAKGDLAKDAGN